jgi:hypothetical protein
MKYSEFLELDAILEQNNITWEEYKKDPVLYEGILGKAGAALWNLAKKGMKNAVSAGLSGTYKEKLNKQAEAIKQYVVKEIGKGKEEGHPLKQVFDAREKTKEGSKERGRLDSEIAKYIHKQVDRQVKKVEKNINDNKHLTDDDKEDMVDYWEDLGIQLNLGVAAALADAKIISGDSLSDLIDQVEATYKPATKDTGKTAGNKITADKSIIAQGKPSGKNKNIS